MSLPPIPVVYGNRARPHGDDECTVCGNRLDQHNGLLCPDTEEDE